MGRKSREKQARRQHRGTATFSVFCPGALEVLSIGKGDMKITIGDSEKDRDDARQVIEEMLRKGYMICVETKDYGPVRVNRFDPAQMEYVVTGLPDPDAGPQPADDLEPKSRRRPTGRKRETRVPVAGTRATAVGRSAGG